MTDNAALSTARAAFPKDRLMSIMGMGFLWLSIHNQALYPVSLIFNKNGDVPAIVFYLIYCAVILITVAVLTIGGMHKRDTFNHRPLIIAFGILALVGFTVLARVGFDSAASTAAVGMGTALCAMFVPIYFGFWSTHIIEASSRASRDVVMSCAFASALQALRLAFGVHSVVFGAVCIAATTALAGFVPIRPLPRSLSDERESLRPQPKALIGALLLVAFMLLAGIILLNPSIATVGYPSKARTFLYVGALAICVVLLAIDRIGNSMPYRAAITNLVFLAVLSIIAMFLTVFGRSYFPEMQNFFLICCKLVIEAYVWALVLRNAQRKHLRICLAMGLYLVFVIYLPNLAAATSLHFDLATGSQEVALVIGMAAGAFVICAALCLVLAASFLGEKNSKQPSTVYADDHERALAKFQETYGLSDRQMDVVRLAYKNWTSRRIGEELFITEGTVKTHLKVIYKQAGVHSKQDLIDAVDALQ